MFVTDQSQSGLDYIFICYLFCLDMDFGDRFGRYSWGGSPVLDIFVMSKMAHGVGEINPKSAYQSMAS